MNSTASVTPDGFMDYTEPLSGSFVDVEVKLNGHIPSWITGDLVNACPSQLTIGKYQLNNFADGFVRYNRYRIDPKGGKLLFSSKIVDDNKYYTASTKAKEPRGALFSFPTPKRTADRVPGISIKWCQ